MKNMIIGAIATGCAAASLGLAAPANADHDGTNGLATLNGPNPCGTSGPVGETRFTFTPA